MYRTEEKGDLFADAVEIGCSALCSIGWTDLLANTSVAPTAALQLSGQEKNIEHLTAATSGSDSPAAICTRGDLPLATTATKELSIYEKSKTRLLAELIWFGRLGF